MRVSPEVEIAFALAQREAARRRHEYVTVEHLLYALLFDEETADIVRHSGGDPAALRKKLEKFLDTEVPVLPEDANASHPSLSLSFNRAVQRAAMHLQSSGKKELKGANVLVALFAERDCPAVTMLTEQGVTRYDVVNYISHGVSKTGEVDVSPEQLPKSASAGMRVSPEVEVGFKRDPRWTQAFLRTRPVEPRTSQSTLPGNSVSRSDAGLAEKFASSSPIAIVQGDPMTRRLLRSMVEAEGFAAVEFGGGRSALAGIDRTTAVVCLDLALDDISGVEVLMRLRSTLPDLPVVVVTARSRVEEVVEAMRAGAYDYLTKPIDPLRFGQAIRRAAVQRAIYSASGDIDVPTVERAAESAPSSRHEPAYESPEVRIVAGQLERARFRKKTLQDAGASTAEADREILDLRRRLREGGHLRAGDTLDDGRYLLLEKMGRGGFASVWAALDRERSERVAIKVLHPDQAREPSRRERFFRGARVMAGLQHPAVVRVRSPRGEDGGFLYFVMDLVEGEDLHRAVVGGRLPGAEAVPLILRIGEALAEAHAKGIVHRDVKPSNILLDASRAPRLTDFDLVAANDTTGGTRTGAMGTFVFTAPEQMSNAKDADARADVFGLGMTALFCLHGKELPAIVTRKPERVIAALECREAVKEVVTRAIELEPEARYADAEAFCGALREATLHPSPVPPPPNAPGGA